MRHVCCCMFCQVHQQSGAGHLETHGFSLMSMQAVVWKTCLPSLHIATNATMLSGYAKGPCWHFLGQNPGFRSSPRMSQCFLKTDSQGMAPSCWDSVSSRVSAVAKQLSCFFIVLHSWQAWAFWFCLMTAFVVPFFRIFQNTTNRYKRYVLAWPGVEFLLVDCRATFWGWRLSQFATTTSSGWGFRGHDSDCVSWCVGVFLNLCQSVFLLLCLVS